MIAHMQFEGDFDDQNGVLRRQRDQSIIVKTGNNGDVTRVRDVGRVELGAQTYSQVFSLIAAVLPVASR